MITILLTVFFTAAGFIFAGSYSDYKIFIHELGHWIYGLGGTISAYVTYVNVDWPLATIGSLLFQLQITLAIVGYARDHYKLRLFQNLGSFERATLDVHAVFLLFYTMYIIILLM
jgi:hypothetical protein